MPGPEPTDERAWRARLAVLRTALSDTRAFVARRRFWGVVSGAVVLAALAGPFYTLERMAFSVRLAYWGAIGLLAALLMTLLSMTARRLNADNRVHWATASMLAGLAGVVPMIAVVHLGNVVFDDGELFSGFGELVLMVGVPVVVITVLVNAVVVARERDLERQAEAIAPLVEDFAAAAAEASTLFEKLPASIGRDVVCMQAQDHYVQVTTTQGSALVLMRLSDAERDLSALARARGVRTHRSWWVNLDHVTAAEKAPGGGATLMTRSGVSVPVSRGQRAAVMEALAGRVPLQ